VTVYLADVYGGFREICCLHKENKLTVYTGLHSYNKINETHKLLKFIFGIELYMFRTGFLSIIRSLVLYTQQYIQVMLTAC